MFWAKRSQIYMTYKTISNIHDIHTFLDHEYYDGCTFDNFGNVRCTNFRNNGELGKFKKRWQIGQNHLKYSSHTFTLSLPTFLDHHIMMEPLTTSTCNAPIKYGNVTVTHSHISIKCLGSPPDFRAIHETFPIIVGEIWTRGRFNRLPPTCSCHTVMQVSRSNSLCPITTTQHQYTFGPDWPIQPNSKNWIENQKNFMTMAIANFRQNSAIYSTFCAGGAGSRDRGWSSLTDEILCKSVNCATRILTEPEFDQDC